MKVTKALMWAVVVLAVAGAIDAAAADDATVEQDPEVLRFVQRSIAWYPNSTFRVVADTRTQTPSGSYRRVRVSRTCDNTILTGEPSVIIDEVTGDAYLGSIGELPFEQAGTSPRTLRPFLEDFLPEVLAANMNWKVRVSWDVPEGSTPGAVIPFNLVIDSGYGEYNKPVAVTSDGRFLVMGGGMPLDGDPVAIRRQRFNESEFVIWDHDGGESSVEVVELSDLECPACRMKWPMIKASVESHGGAVRHGMVSFPITSIHPWAFRASSATWCVGEQQRELVIDFKELFYELQRDMEVTLVTPTSLDFAAGNGLDEERFRACYLRKPSLDAVHGQLALGNWAGINATPTYFVNGWMIQMPAPEWFPDLIERLIAGEEP